MIAVPAALDAAFRGGLERYGFQEAGFSLVTSEAASFQGAGGWTPDRPAPLMSSSKWLTALVVMSLVDAGELGLDQPLAELLPELTEADPAKAAITVRHCLSLTTGLPSRHPAIMDPSLTFDDCLRLLAREPLLAPPGAALVYGGNGFQLLGAAAERATGRSWHDLFAGRVAGPLGLQATRFADGRTRNPWLAGGAVSTLADFAQVLRLHVTGAGPVRPQSLQEMTREQTAGAAVLSSPFPPDHGYGLGLWIDRRSAAGLPERAGSHGGAGSIPWLDLGRGYGAHLFIHQPDHAAFSGFRGGYALSEELEPAIQAALPA
jgi:CubicO group peptidase (beta-lactamase class C family)